MTDTPPTPPTPEPDDQLRTLQEQLDRRVEQLALAEAQRDEANSRLTEVQSRAAAERMLLEAGAADMETASLLLAKRIDLAESPSREKLAGVVETLLLEKPFLRATSQTDPIASPMPAVTSSPRNAAPRGETQLANVAQRAAASGNRRDIAEYLRLRRQLAQTP